MLQVTDSTGAAVYSTALVTINSALVASTVSVSESAVDQGQTSTLSCSSVTTGSESYTYQWLAEAPSGLYVDVGTNSTSYSFATTAFTTTGAWSFKLQVTDGVGVVVTSSAKTVTVYSVPSASITPISVTLNVGQPQTFTAAPTGGSGSYTYKWYLKGLQVSAQTASTYPFTAPAAGSTSVYAVVTDSDGVSATSNTVTFTVGEGTATVGASSFTPASPITLGTSVTVSASVTGPGGVTAPTGNVQFG